MTRSGTRQVAATHHRHPLSTLTAINQHDNTAFSQLHLSSYYFTFQHILTRTP